MALVVILGACATGGAPFGSRALALQGPADPKVEHRGTSKKHQEEIKTLMAAAPSKQAAQALEDWAEDARARIARGDMSLGILTADEADMIPKAYRRAAELGRAESWISLARWHAEPAHGKQDLVAAEAAIQRAIDANAAGADLEQVKFRWYYRQTTASEAQRQESYRAAEKSVENEPRNADAIHLLAMLTTSGFGVNASPAKGFELEKRAADLGDVNAMFELFLHHAKGLGTPMDEAKAIAACRRAAEAGQPRANYNMGAFYARGSGVPKDLIEAARWYERAAELGSASAMVNLAAMYATGSGVKKDLERAAELLDRAESLGLDVADIRKQLKL